MYHSGLRCGAAHLDSATRLLSDRVVTALGTCMLTTTGIVARRLDVDLTHAIAHVKKEMVSAPARQIGTLTVELNCPASVPAEARVQLEPAALTCPVYIETRIRMFNFPIERKMGTS